MPPFTVEPGTRLVDRYRLEAPLAEASGASYWRAHDELLGRPVGLCLLRQGADGTDRVLAAARQAAAVTDSRFLRVLDASEGDGVVYVVTEWVQASSLGDLVADAPLPPDEARTMAMDVAAALSAAHTQGLAHLCLGPEHVLRTAHGQVKVSGLAVDAAVRGVRAADGADAALRDAEGCAAVLYAALTARWPGAQPSTLAPAPFADGHLATPRQVRAGIPDDLDVVTCRVLGAPTRHNEPPLRTPGEVAAELNSAHVTARIPAVVTPQRRGDEGATPTYAPRHGEPRPRRGPATTAAWALAALVLAIGLGLTGWQVITAANGTGDSPGPTPTSTAQPSSDSRPVDVAAATGFDPPPGNGEENSDTADLVLDGDPTTAWTTKTYFDPFGPGGLKDGVGLLLDLGRKQQVSSVAVSVQGGDTGLQLRVADEQGEQADDYRTVAESPASSGLVTLRPERPVQARYALLWITQIPSADGSNWQAAISEVGVRG